MQWKAKTFWEDQSYERLNVSSAESSNTQDKAGNNGERSRIGMDFWKSHGSAHSIHSERRIHFLHIATHFRFKTRSQLLSQSLKFQ